MPCHLMVPALLQQAEVDSWLQTAAWHLQMVFVVVCFCCTDTS